MVKSQILELDELKKELEEQLDLKKIQILPVWKGFLISCKIHKKTPSVLWIPNKKIHGIVNREELINKVIELSGLTISALIPYASEVRLLLLQAMPNPPQNGQIYVSNLHSITISHYSITPDHKIPVLGNIKKTTKSFLKFGQKSVEGIISKADSVIHKNSADLSQKEVHSKESSTQADLPIIKMMSIKFHSILDEKRHRKLAVEAKDENTSKIKRLFAKIETTISGPETNQFLCSNIEVLEEFGKKLQKQKFDVTWNLKKEEE